MNIFPPPHVSTWIVDIITANENSPKFAPETTKRRSKMNYIVNLVFSWLLINTSNDSYSSYHVISLCNWFRIARLQFIFLLFASSCFLRTHLIVIMHYTKKKSHLIWPITMHMSVNWSTNNLPCLLDDYWWRALRAKEGE
jgi:hypothetical protein